MNNKLHSLFLLLMGGLLLPAFTHAQDGPVDTKAVQARMKERLPTIVALKVEGKIGEARNGLLAIRGELSEEKNQDGAFGEQGSPNDL